MKLPRVRGEMKNIHHLNGIYIYIYTLYVYIYTIYWWYIFAFAPNSGQFHIYFHIYAPSSGQNPHIFAYIRPEFGTISNSIVPNSGYMCFWQRCWNFPSTWVIFTATFWWKTQTQLLWKLPAWRLKPMRSHNIYFVVTWITTCTTITKNTRILWNS